MQTKTVWKFKLSSGFGPYEIEMPIGSMILAIQMQHGEPTAWAMVNPDAPTEIRRFLNLATGEEFDPAGLGYLASFQIGWIVYHVFESWSTDRKAGNPATSAEMEAMYSDPQ